MNTEKQPDKKDSASILQNPFARKVIIYGTVLIAAFLIGFIPMWLSARSCSDNLSDTQNQLKAAQMRNTIATAAIDARRGEYEPARQAASDFFTNLRTEMESDENTVLTQSQRERVRPLLSIRDEIITQLARSDPAAADRLSTFYTSYVKAIDPPQAK